MTQFILQPIEDSLYLFSLYRFRIFQDFSNIELTCIIISECELCMSDNDVSYKKPNAWRGMIEGDTSVFLTIYQDQYQALFSYGYSIAADKELVKDCIQEVFLEIWKTRKTITTDVGNVRSYLFTWLRRKIHHDLSLRDKAKSFILSQNS